MAKKKSEDVSSYAQFFPGIITEEENSDKDEGKTNGAEPGDAPTENQDSKDVKEVPDVPEDVPNLNKDDKSVEAVESEIKRKPTKNGHERCRHSIR